MNKLSCNSGLLSKYSIFEAIKILNQNGYQGIEICLEPNPPFYPIPKPHLSVNIKKKEIKEIKNYADAFKIEIPALNAHTNLIDGNPKKRNENINFIIGAIKLASELETPYVITGGGSKNLYGTADSYWEILFNVLDNILDLSKKLGVTIAIEAAGLPGNLIHNVEGMKNLFSNISSNNLKVLFDPSHYFIRGDDIINAYETFNKEIVHIHIKDAMGNFENFTFPPLGDGDIPFGELFKIINKSNYNGYFSIEYEAFAWGYKNSIKNILKDSKEFIIKNI